MKHLMLTSKEMPATAQEGGITTNPKFLGFWPRNDFRIWPFSPDFIQGFTGIDKGSNLP